MFILQRKKILFFTSLREYFRRKKLTLRSLLLCWLSFQGAGKERKIIIIWEFIFCWFLLEFQTFKEVENPQGRKVMFHWCIARPDKIELKKITKMLLKRNERLVLPFLMHIYIWNILTCSNFPVNSTSSSKFPLPPVNASITRASASLSFSLMA